MRLRHCPAIARGRNETPFLYCGAGSFIEQRITAGSPDFYCARGAVSLDGHAQHDRALFAVAA